jgi:hypothetical protein
VLRLQVAACVTDTAANMAAAGKLLTETYGVPWHGCFAHLLELISGGLFKSPFLKSTLVKARKTIGSFTMSSQQLDLLRE